MATVPIEVLLLEDDEEDSLLLQATLERVAPGQFRFTLVPCLNDALDLLQTRVFDIVLTDLNLPDSLGIDTFRRIRMRAALIPVLVWSGLADEGMAIEAVQLGAQDYLIKGESKGSQVVRAIRYAFERDKLQKAQVATTHPKKGKTVAFVGVKGGVGTTTVAANVAAALACEAHRVTLVELHPGFGTLSVQLGRNRPTTNLRHSLDRGVAAFNDRDLIAPLISTVPNLRVLFTDPQAAEEFAAIGA